MEPLRRPGSLRGASAAIVCLGASDAVLVKKMPDIAPFVERVDEFLKFLGCGRLLVLGPLGLRNPKCLSRISYAIAKSVAAMDGCTVATFFDVSPLSVSCYQKDRAHLTPGGHEELASLIAGRLQGLLQLDGVCEGGAPPGIGNDGSSCYQIATCQALFAIPIVRSLLITHAGSRKGANRLAELAKSVEKAKDARSVWVANDPFLAKDAGMQPGQQDAAEFLDRALSRYGGAGDEGLRGIFAGIYRKVTTCLFCRMETRTDQKSGTFCAPIMYETKSDFCDLGKILMAEYPVATLIRKECYGGHTSEDGLGSDHAVKVEWVVPPEILIVHVMRFRDVDGKDVKVIPEGRDAVAPRFLEQCSSSYELRSVVEHVGKSAKSGHYIAYSSEGGNGRWRRYDDAVVTLSSESEATRRPYIAFYQRL